MGRAIHSPDHDAMANFWRKNLRIYSPVLLILAALLAACSLPGGGPASTPTPGAVPQQESPAAVSAEGRVVPRHHANLATAASGQITEILVEEGQQVEAGAVILRLGDLEQNQANIAAAEMALLSAQQELDELDKNAGLELALARQVLAEANKERSQFDDEVENLSEPVPQAVLDQAYASLVEAEHRLEKANDNLEKTEKHYKNKSNILWKFLTNKQFKDLLTSLRTARDRAQARLYDMQDKYDDLKAHPDVIKLAQAQANQSHVQARIDDIRRNIARLEKGPDPDKLAAVQARLNAAQTALTAAQSAMKNSEILAPFAGTIADLSVSVGEWVQADQAVVVLADLSEWEIQTDDLTELDVPVVRPGQAVTVRADALPELELKGTVETIKDLSEEKRGDVTYTVTILLDQLDPRLRWGMTVAVDFGQ
jgi:HlyD family secretion protein